MMANSAKLTSIFQNTSTRKLFSFILIVCVIGLKNNLGSLTFYPNKSKMRF